MARKRTKVKNKKISIILFLLFFILVLTSQYLDKNVGIQHDLWEYEEDNIQEIENNFQATNIQKIETNGEILEIHFIDKKMVLCYYADKGETIYI